MDWDWPLLLVAPRRFALLLAALASPWLLGGCHGPGLAPGACSSDAQCGGSTPRCDPQSATCVPCLPASDNCPSGTHCTSSGGHFTCVTGCLRNAHCSTDTAPTCCDGACVDVGADPGNCGGCGLRCAAGPHQVATCAGTCKPTCEPGWADCNGNPHDGCEAALDSDPSNCGACGSACGRPAHATAACNAGSCAIAACDRGFLDCNNNPLDGCEVEAGRDPANCGACGHACPHNAPDCGRGVCGVGYFRQGPQTQVPANALFGWTECYSDGMNFMGNLAQLLQLCQGQRLMMACRRISSVDFELLAWAPRADVLFDPGLRRDCTPNQKLHNANGTDWYFIDGWSWGFAAPGDANNLCSCDALKGAHPELKLCWHTNGGNLEPGYRCGNWALGPGWERVLLVN